jgi:hypothetical protein
MAAGCWGARKEGGGRGAAGACFSAAVSLPPVRVTTAAARAAREQVETEVNGTRVSGKQAVRVFDLTRIAPGRRISLDG